jgi:hypothetical protein
MPHKGNKPSTISELSDILSALKDQIEDDLVRLNSRLSELGDMLGQDREATKIAIEEIKDEHATNTQGVKDQIETVERKINAKLDAVDSAFRGDTGRVGIFEQLRNVSVKIKILFALIVLLMGAKVMNLDMEGWVKGIFGHKTEIKTVQPDTKPVQN